MNYTQSNDKREMKKYSATVGVYLKTLTGKTYYVAVKNPDRRSEQKCFS
jgi:hypothetical protein